MKTRTWFILQMVMPSKRRRRWFGQFPVPFGVFPNSFLLVRRRVQRGSGGSFDHGHWGRDRKSSPVPIFALTRLTIGSRRIGLRSRRSRFLLFPRTQRGGPQAAPWGIDELVFSIRASRSRRGAVRSRRGFQDFRTGHWNSEHMVSCF